MTYRNKKVVDEIITLVCALLTCVVFVGLIGMRKCDSFSELMACIATAVLLAGMAGIYVFIFIHSMLGLFLSREMDDVVYTLVLLIGVPVFISGLAQYLGPIAIFGMQICSGLIGISGGGAILIIGAIIQRLIGYDYW